MRREPLKSAVPTKPRSAGTATATFLTDRRQFSATKTNSLIDRLKAIEVPDVDDVTDDLETTEGAEELDAKIEQTDELIDEIVYELYGLTDEEIEIEEAVN